MSGTLRLPTSRTLGVGRISGFALVAGLRLLGAEGAPLANAPEKLPEMVVTATRMQQTVGQSAAPVDAINNDTLAHSPSLALDDALRASAAFSLFRRGGSLIANPTAQGVSLRGLGPSGASRSLVLLEGIPLNDPFGGWIAWSKVPRLTLQRAEIVRGGGSGVWGNAALGGTVQLFAPPPEVAGGALTAEVGAFDTQRVEFVSSFDAGTRSKVQIGGRGFRTEGPWQYTESQRGAIDRRFDSRHLLGHASYATTLGSGLRFSAGIRAFDEDRGNGTPFQENHSREQAAHARLTGTVRPGVDLDVLAYGQRQHFSSGFSAVDATRTMETPSLDQFDVPATAWGGAVVTTWTRSPMASTAIGADVRNVRGATREDFFFSAGEFLRRRHAGGDQLAAGVFAAHQRLLTPELTLQAATRIDYWSNRGGHRREWTKSTGATLRNDTFANARGTEFSPVLGLAWHPTPAFTWRTSTYRAFRVPTLNELHRPFRVGNVATEANPLLRRETVTGIETGIDYRGETWQTRINVFQQDLHDGVANVTLTSTPALTQRQRLNLDAIRVRGFEASISVQMRRTLILNFDYLHTDARVISAVVAPGLAGKRLAQVPRHTATLSGSWRPNDLWRVEATGRAITQQYEDDENRLSLAAVVTLDFAVRWTIGPRDEVMLTVENVTDAAVETGRTASGLVSFSPGRFVRTGWARRW